VLIPLLLYLKSLVLYSICKYIGMLCFGSWKKVGYF
jgi:hypothetical protein